MEIAIGRVYEAADGSKGMCIADTKHDSGWFVVAVVMPPEEMALCRAYRSDGTVDGAPDIVKELWRLS